MLEISFDTLRPLGLHPTLAQRALQQAAALQPGLQPDLRLARVTEVQRDALTLHDGLREHAARLRPHLLQQLQAEGQPLTIGDWVLMNPDSSDPNSLTRPAWVEARIEPLTQIARRANDGRRQPLASNVDVALLVMGLDADFNARRMERSLALVRSAEVAPVVVLTKTDIAPHAAARIAEMNRRLPATVPVLPVNGLTGEAAHALAPWLHLGQTLVLLGSSGAGKSTLINTLTQAGQATGGVRLGDGRGRHTTTARSLHRCAQGACIIDTPGLRTFRPDADAAELAATFEDIQALAAQCRFRDCQHQHEPGCRVRDQLDADRLLNYQKLLRDAERVELTPLERIEKRNKWKVISKAGTLRAREKKGVGGG